MITQNDTFIKEYREYLKTLSTQRLRLAAWFAIVLVPAGSFFDFFIYPQFLKTFFIIRVSSTLLFLAVYAMSFFEFWKVHSIGLGVFLTELVALPIVVMIQFAGGYSSPYYAGLNLIILAVGVVFPWGIKPTIVSCFLIYGTYLLPILLSNKIEDMGIFINNNYFLSFTIIIALISNYFASRLRQQEFTSRFKLNKAYEQLKNTQAQLIHSEKMASLGQLVAGVAHEINNPINAAAWSAKAMDENIEEIQEKTIRHKMKEINTTVKNGLWQAAKIVSDLKNFSKKDTEGFKPEDIHQGLDATLHMLHHRLEDRITIHKDYSNEFEEVECNLGQLNQVFLNTLQNAIDAIENTGDIWIKTKRINNKVCISIKDSGVGISPKDIEHVFDPFFTTKEVGKGVGLGMSISYRLIENHHGTIDVKSTPGNGAEFTIILPLKQEVLHEQYI